LTYKSTKNSKELHFFREHDIAVFLGHRHTLHGLDVYCLKPLSFSFNDEFEKMVTGNAGGSVIQFQVPAILGMLNKRTAIAGTAVYDFTHIAV
jgi:hypothetical protein